MSVLCLLLLIAAVTPPTGLHLTHRGVEGHSQGFSGVDRGTVSWKVRLVSGSWRFCKISESLND